MLFGVHDVPFDRDSSMTSQGCCHVVFTSSDSHLHFDLVSSNAKQALQWSLLDVLHVSNHIREVGWMGCGQDSGEWGGGGGGGTGGNGEGVRGHIYFDVLGVQCFYCNLARTSPNGEPQFITGDMFASTTRMS